MSGRSRAGRRTRRSGAPAPQASMRGDDVKAAFPTKDLELLDDEALRTLLMALVADMARYGAFEDERYDEDELDDDWW